MTNSTFMNVFYSSNQLLVHSDCSFFMKTLMRNYIVEKLTILAEFHDQKQLTFSFDDFVKLYDVWVPYFFQNFDFTADSFYIFFVFNS